MIQNILVLLIFLVAVGYLVTKYIWKPAFLSGKDSGKSCGSDNCGCN
ncbi:FeoB-associated Cys-rich membrane protein [Leeuwenhoekiella aequorea]|uniref:Attachment p12 family protein n=1 Tax=Leeuwenhoekiella aequorea TaxID=283736 RepID=A0A4Q0PCC2_9FLAO|nr:FeoB-associated Cys-rich membrane protein [Leeuwenhoekiella aequorea]RXG24463.1 attachment p12 family protein [Leeuwenhoekiella aequorea]